MTIDLRPMNKTRKSVVMCETMMNERRDKKRHPSILCRRCRLFLGAAANFQWHNLFKRGMHGWKECPGHEQLGLSFLHPSPSGGTGFLPPWKEKDFINSATQTGWSGVMQSKTWTWNRKPLDNGHIYVQKTVRRRVPFRIDTSRH